MDLLLSRITIDPNICHGKPCIRGLRYPVEWLLELLSSGMSHDEVLAGQRASYIKMNIEGAEIDALHGAHRTIEHWLPKLAISVYHRPSDLWRIPQLVRELGSRYALFLRQHDGGVIETVLYAIAR